MGGLPTPAAWEDDRTRQQYSAAMLTQLVSTAVTGLQTLDPSVRVSPSSDEAFTKASPDNSVLAQAMQQPIIRTKRVSDRGSPGLMLQLLMRLRTSETDATKVSQLRKHVNA